MTRKNLLLNAWYLLVICIGLFFAWREGASTEALLFGAFGAAAIVCIAMVVTVLMRRISR